jgi:hypothetical protein
MECQFLPPCFRGRLLKLFNRNRDPIEIDIDIQQDRGSDPIENSIPRSGTLLCESLRAIMTYSLKRPEGPAVARPGRQAGIGMLLTMSAEGAALQYTGREMGTLAI